MNYRACRVISWIALFFLVLVFSPCAYATWVRAGSVEQLTQHSDVVVYGVVLLTTCHPLEMDICTDVVVDVSQVIAGRIDKNPITLRLPGGKIGPRETHVSGVPEFSVGETVVLFLTPRRDGYWTVLGEAQGRFTILKEEGDKQPRAARDLKGLVLMDGPGTKEKTLGENSMMLNALLDLIRKGASKERVE